MSAGGDAPQGPEREAGGASQALAVGGADDEGPQTVPLGSWPDSLWSTGICSGDCLLGVCHRQGEKLTEMNTLRDEYHRLLGLLSSNLACEEDHGGAGGGHQHQWACHNAHEAAQCLWSPGNGMARAAPARAPPRAPPPARPVDDGTLYYRRTWSTVHCQLPPVRRRATPTGSLEPSADMQWTAFPWHGDSRCTGVHTFIHNACHGMYHHAAATVTMRLSPGQAQRLSVLARDPSGRSGAAAARHAAAIIAGLSSGESARPGLPWVVEWLPEDPVALPVQRKGRRLPLAKRGAAVRRGGGR
eukprot:TRINITY_DN4298_c0_g1_i2.p1 TRINITY_DN4298_c0_g1~~TRINITY_DN4298_c0_g1_i2.p1  ORF type:complete len:325 (+),score=26.56 TRINITY_DN4298_c0_g1_i2:75-977(+)